MRVYTKFNDWEVIDKYLRHREDKLTRLLTVFCDKNGYFHTDLHTVACMALNYTWNILNASYLKTDWKYEIDPRKHYLYIILLVNL